MRYLILAGLLCCSTVSFAGIKIIGNGGDVFDCGSGVLSLDFYEGAQTFTYDLADLSGDAENQARQVLDRLARKSEGAAKVLRKNLEEILRNVVYTDEVNVELMEVDDSYHASRPRGCSLKQLGIFVREGPLELLNKLVVNAGLHARMHETQFAFFLLHEAAYKYLREKSGDHTSNRARRIVQYIFSQEFTRYSQVDQVTTLARLGVTDFKLGPVEGEILFRHPDGAGAGIEFFEARWRAPFFFRMATGGDDGLIKALVSVGFSTPQKNLSEQVLIAVRSNIALGEAGYLSVYPLGIYQILFKWDSGVPRIANISGFLFLKTMDGARTIGTRVEVPPATKIN